MATYKIAVRLTGGPKKLVGGHAGGYLILLPEGACRIEGHTARLGAKTWNFPAGKLKDTGTWQLSGTALTCEFSGRYGSARLTAVATAKGLDSLRIVGKSTIAALGKLDITAVGRGVLTELVTPDPGPVVPVPGGFPPAQQVPCLVGYGCNYYLSQQADLAAYFHALRAHRINFTAWEALEFHPTKNDTGTSEWVAMFRRSIDRAGDIMREAVRHEVKLLVYAGGNANSDIFRRDADRKVFPGLVEELCLKLKPFAESGFLLVNAVNEPWAEENRGDAKARALVAQVEGIIRKHFPKKIIVYNVQSAGNALPSWAGRKELHTCDLKKYKGSAGHILVTDCGGSIGQLNGSGGWFGQGVSVGTFEAAVRDHAGKKHDVMLYSFHQTLKPEALQAIKRTLDKVFPRSETSPGSSPGAGPMGDKPTPATGGADSIDLSRVVHVGGGNRIDLTKTVISNELRSAVLEAGKSHVRLDYSVPADYWAGNSTLQLVRLHVYWQEGSTVYGGHVDWLGPQQSYKTLNNLPPIGTYIKRRPPAGVTLHFVVIANDGRRRTRAVATAEGWR